MPKLNRVLKPWQNGELSSVVTAQLTKRNELSNKRLKVILVLGLPWSFWKCHLYLRHTYRLAAAAKAMVGSVPFFLLLYPPHPDLQYVHQWGIWRGSLLCYSCPISVLSEEMGVTDGRRVWLRNRRPMWRDTSCDRNGKTMEAWKIPALLGQTEGRQPCLLC